MFRALLATIFYAKVDLVDGYNTSQRNWKIVVDVRVARSVDSWSMEQQYS